jgi:hypothetical protein
MDRSYIAENDAERARLRALVARLSDDELSHPMPAGWTVAGVLAHLAFWDARVVYILNRWKSGAGSITPTEHEDVDWIEHGDVDWINEGAKPLCLALQPRVAADLALQQAEAADQGVAALSDDVLAKIASMPPLFNLSRAIHRREHLDEIERVV